ncbi:hypothetical protein RFI_15226, partial [Reticulomyxa filosa]
MEDTELDLKSEESDHSVKQGGSTATENEEAESSEKKDEYKKKVKKGYDKKTSKCVALKFMAKADNSWAEEQVNSKQVITEIDSLKQIRHQNVMKLYAYNLNAKYPTKNSEKLDCVLLVLEFAPGGELFDILYYTSALEP